MLLRSLRYFFLPNSYSFQCNNQAYSWHVCCQNPEYNQESLPSGGSIVRSKQVCMHTPGTPMSTITVPLVYSVAQSVLEMTTVGSAFKVVPKPQQLSPSQHKVKGL